MNLRLATLQRLVVLAVLALAIAYLALLRPLTRKVAEEEAPLAALRETLAQATLEAGLPRGTDFLTLGERLASLRATVTAFTAAERQARPRLEHPPDLRARLEEPFQFVEFLNESQRRLEELAALAQTGKVTLTHGLARGFPSYKPELARPELLWIQLATVNRTVRTAIRAGVREITEVSVESLPLAEPADFGPVLPPRTATPPQKPNQPASLSPGETNAWTTLRVHITAQGTVDALSRMLLALALTPDELKRTGLPEELGAQPALFLERILIRRHKLDAPEEAQLELVVATVVANGTL